MSTPAGSVRPTIYGYVRLLPDCDEQMEACFLQDVADFAEREGFALAEVFCERKWLQCAAWDALVKSCVRQGVRNVVVPDYRHLHTMPALGHMMQAVIEQAIAGYVWCVHPDASVIPRSAAP